MQVTADIAPLAKAASMAIQERSGPARPAPIHRQPAVSGPSEPAE